MKSDFKRKILKNGMTVLFEKRNTPVVSVAFAVRAGGGNESLEEKGLFHFIEHMLFKGTSKQTSREISTKIEGNGGELNGFTSEFITAYWCKMPFKKINIALEVLGDMVKNPLFEKEEIEKERKVIFEEIKMRGDNPTANVLDGIKELLYHEPFGNPIIGTYETMNSIDQNKMINQFKESYSTNNLILCVVGNADFDEIINFAETNFENNSGIILTPEIQKKNSYKIKKRKGVDQANLVFAYHVPFFKDKQNYAAQVLSTLMSGGFSSRLFHEIRDKRNLAYAIHGESDINLDFAFNYIYVGTSKDNVKKVEELIIDEFKKIAENLKKDELDKIKEQLIGNHQISMEDSNSQMVNLLSYEINGNVQEFYEFEKNILNVKLKDVQDLAEKAAKEYSFFALVPE